MLGDSTVQNVKKTNVRYKESPINDIKQKLPNMMVQSQLSIPKLKGSVMSLD